MLANQAKKRKLLPELDDMFESVQVVRSRYQIEPHGSEVCFFNLQAASKHGEISRSDASCSGPVLRPPPPGLRGSQLTFFVFTWKSSQRGWRAVTCRCTTRNTACSAGGWRCSTRCASTSPARSRSSHLSA
eukprot:1476149-Rhodomonas_salina.8